MFYTVMNVIESLGLLPADSIWCFWTPGQILHGLCPTFPVLFGLLLLLNKISQLACLMWLCLNEGERRTLFLPFAWLCEEKFSDLWKRRPKAAFTKPSKAPSGSQGPCVTLLTKITFSSGPLSLSSLLLSCPLYILFLFPLPENTNVAEWGFFCVWLQSLGCCSLGFLKWIMHWQSVET